MHPFDPKAMWSIRTALYKRHMLYNFSVFNSPLLGQRVK